MPRRRLPWQRLPVPVVTRESAAGLVDQPPKLPDPFEYAAGSTRLVASTRSNEPSSVWKQPLIVDQYPAPELFQTLDQLMAWQDVLTVDLYGAQQERDDNVGLLGGLFTGFMLGFPPALFLAGGGLASFAAVVVMALALIVGMWHFKLPYSRLDRLRLVDLAYRRRARELQGGLA